MNSLASRPGCARNPGDKPRHPFTAHALSMTMAATIVAAMPLQHAIGQTPTPSAGRLPEVSVTAPALRPEQQTGNLATGLPGSTLDTPFSTTTVPQTRIADQAGTTLQDALRNVPGAQADSGFNGSHTQFYVLRGAITDSGTGSNRVLRDGVRLSNYPYVPAFALSVDVLRGPGAAIGVRSEPGGTVDIVTRQPQLANFGSVSVGGGSHGVLDTTVDLNRVLSQDKELAARVIATHSAASEWRGVPDRLTGLKFGIAKSDANRYHLRLGFEATNQTYQADYGIPALGNRPVAVPRNRQLGEPFADSTTDNRIADLHGDMALGGDWRLAADLTHLEAHSTAVRNVLFGNPLPRQLPGTWNRVTAWEPDTNRRIDSAATALTGSQTWGGAKNNFYFGLDYYKENLNQPAASVPASTSPPINVFFPVYGRVTAPLPAAFLSSALTTERLESAALSAQDQIDFGPWSLVAGLRYTKQKFLFGPVGTLPVDESRWSPKIALLRRFGDSDTVYANFATGISPNQVSSSGNQSLPSRRSAQVEVGWKALWQNGQLISDLALYQLNQRNLIAADQSTPTNLFDFTVNGSARSRGLEASLTGRLGERIDIAATYAYTQALYRENPVYGGNQVPNVARHSASLWGQYDWHRKSDWQWKTGVGLYAQSKRFADEANAVVLPGYARIDLVQSWTRKLAGGQSVELQLALRNLLDKQYFVSSHLHVSRWITPGEGRNFALTGTYRF